MNNPNSSRSLYDVLGVSSTATQSEIKAAYRRLCKQYHPDINPSPEADRRIREINYAYEVLGDPAKRAAYDVSLGVPGETSRQEAEDPLTYAHSFAQQVKCQGCGCFDHTLRVVTFPYVFSILIMSFKRAEAGIYCARCRSAKSTKWAAISLLFGPWGFPWGIIWTIQSLIANIKKGEAPREPNIVLLKQLAWVNAVLGRIDEAKASIRELLRYTRDAEAVAFKDDLDNRFPSVAPASISGFRFGFTLTITLILATYGFVGYSLFSGAPDTYTPPSTPSTTAPQSYLNKVTSWITSYGEIRDRYLDKVNIFTSYEQAIANSGIVISESNLFITSTESLLKEIAATTNIPESYANLHSALRGFIDVELRYANLFKEAVQYQSISKWNEAVDLTVTVRIMQQNCINQMKASGLYK